MCSHDVRHVVCYHKDTSGLKLRGARPTIMYIPGCTITL